MLIVISGVSGVGKNTIIESLLKSRQELKFFKSATTRPRRDKENHHYFFSEEEFARRKANGEFFETENVHGFNYGIMQKDIDKILSDIEHNYIRDVDVHGVQNLRKYFKEKNSKMLSIFIDAPNAELQKRLKGRGESDDRISTRLSRAGLERRHRNKYDYVVQNIDLEKAIQEINEIIDNFDKNF